MENNKLSLDEFNKIFMSYVDKTAKCIQAVDLSEFELNLVKKNNLDFNKGEDLLTLLRLKDESLFLNYFARAELVVLRRYLENRKQREFTKEEAFDRAQKMRTTFIDILRKMPIDELNTSDRADIYEEIGMLKKIDEKILFEPEINTVIKRFRVYDLSVLQNRYLCISSLKSKKKFDDIGLQTFIKEEVPNILEKDPLEKVLIRK